MTRVARVWLALAVALAACSDGGSTGPASGTPADVRVLAGDQQTAVTGMPVVNAPRVVVTDASGKPVPNVTIDFVVTAGNGFVLPKSTETNDQGIAATTWYLGPRSGQNQGLAARTAAGVSATFTATTTAAASGTTYLGRNGYMEYQPGTLPLIISAPHGGTLTPAEIKDRTYGTTDRDTNTEELVREIANAFQRSTGKRPHIIISRLHRRKLDPNREIVEAAQGNVYAEHAWQEWNTFIAAARHTVQSAGDGLYIDFHGHGHAIARLELGYLLTAGELALPAATLAGESFVQRSSIRSLVQGSGRSLPQLLTGASAFGTLFENAGIPAVPSAQQPHPGNDPYFNGGYNTQQYGSRNGGTVDGIQIESHYTGIRNTADARTAFADKLVTVLQQFYTANYGFALR